MRLLSDAAAKAWCETIGHTIVGEIPLLRLVHAREAAPVRRLWTPDESRAVVDLAFRLVMAHTPNDLPELFPGALFWLHRWEIGSEDIDGVGERLLAGTRGVTDARSDLHAYPAQAFDAGECQAAHAALVVPMLFAWDAYYVPADGSYLLWVSHEGSLDLIPRDAAADAHLGQRTSPFVNL